MSEKKFDSSESRMDVLTKKAPRRGEGERILWFLLCSVPLNVEVSLLVRLLNRTVIDFLNSNSSWIGERVGEFMMRWNCVLFLIWLLEEAGAALMNRRLTFRSRAGWYWAIPAQLGVYLIFRLMNGNVAFNMISGPLTIALWLVISYVFQRFVIYRRTLDTNGLAQRRLL